jgi:hypothetical protein
MTSRFWTDCPRAAARDPGDAPSTLDQKPKRTATSLPVPFVLPPAALRGLISLGFDQVEAAIVIAHQLCLPPSYLAKAFSVPRWKVKKALDKAELLGYSRIPRRDLLKRPRPVNEAERQKILEEREKLMERIRRLARLTGLSDDCRLGLLL